MKFKDPKKTFNEEEVKGIIKEIVEQTILQDSAYLHSRISNWNATIVDLAVKRLAALNKSFKYIGNLNYLFLEFNKKNIYIQYIPILILIFKYLL